MKNSVLFAGTQTSRGQKNETNSMSLTMELFGKDRSVCSGDVFCLKACMLVVVVSSFRPRATVLCFLTLTLSCNEAICHSWRSMKSSGASGFSAPEPSLKTNYSIGPNPEDLPWQAEASPASRIQPLSVVLASSPTKLLAKLKLFPGLTCLFRCIC